MLTSAVLDYTDSEELLPTNSLGNLGSEKNSTAYDYIFVISVAFVG